MYVLYAYTYTDRVHPCGTRLAACSPSGAGLAQHQWPSSTIEHVSKSPECDPGGGQAEPPKQATQDGFGASMQSVLLKTV